MICTDVYALPYRCIRKFRDVPPIFPLSCCCSLDCRHVWCGPCLVGWFAFEGDTTCPGCRAESSGQPQRDIALGGILSVVYEALGRDVPTTLSENFDPSIFAIIYAEKEQGGYLEQRERIMNTAFTYLQDAQRTAGASDLSDTDV